MPTVHILILVQDIYQELKYLFFLLSIFADGLISTPKIIIFLLVPLIRREKNPCVANPIPYPEYLYLSIPAFLVKLIAPNQQFFRVEY